LRTLRSILLNPYTLIVRRKSTFSASSYATFRPTYPSVLFRIILDYHNGPKTQCLDLGTGHGLIARELSPSFTHVIGTDPSSGMVAQAKASTTEPNIAYRQASAEDLDFIADGSLDMVVAGQAAHWFNYNKVWPELKRTLRRGGTLAFWGYKDNVFVDYPRATKVLDYYCYGPGKDLMGMYWEQPGRSILRQRYRSLLPPDSDFEDVQRFEYEPGTQGSKSGTLGEVLMQKRLKLGEMEGYARTFSAYHGWAETHRDKKPKKDGEEGDIVDKMFEEMLKIEPEWRDEGDNWRDKEVECEWGSVILLARRK
jgi:trans-aconitate 3-methyltransferase